MSEPSVDSLRRAATRSATEGGSLPAPATRRRQLPALTGLRAVAAAAVFLTHAAFDLTSTSLGGTIRAVSPWSTVGVILFFALSGYLLADAASWRFGTRIFARHRVARIVPLYAAALVAGVVLVAAQAHRHGYFDGRLHPGNLLLNVFLLQAWSPHGIAASIDIPAWSLSVEALFYLALPFTIHAFRRLCIRAPRRTLTVILAGLMAGGLAMTFGWCPDSFPPAFLPVFYLGGYLTVAQPSVPRPGVCVLAGLGPFVFYTIFHAAGHAPTGLAVLLVALPCAVLVHSLATHGGRLLESRWLVRFGIWSYAFFLVHTLVIFVTSALKSSPPTSTALGLGLFATDFVTAWAIAAAAYRVIERPAQERLTRPGAFIR